MKLYIVPMMRDRHRLALEMREAGATFQAIGDSLGVSASRANVIYQRAVVVKLEHDVGLRMRSIRVVRGSSRSADEWAALLSQDSDAAFLALLREPGCDRAHAEEIMAWLKAGKGRRLGLVLDTAKSRRLRHELGLS